MATIFLPGSRPTRRLQHIPVIVISAVDELDKRRQVHRARGNKLPDQAVEAVDPTRRGSSASLASKRLRDLELEYLEQVGKVTEKAAVAVEER